ncbi:hypothetical protein CVT24_011500 [Panaeolus cyanescens]|uniref:Cytochrome P450 n=1 Tax=Panaeolus cyanescens TaxID=181874 RepID=A0A409VGN3_9AGAR|nr:hypothetical protein CVT24_011500 [Panaeolus cyanescens]
MGWDIDMALLPHNQWWRRHRRAFHEHFHASAVAKYQPIQLRECRAFLHRLLNTPDDFFHHIKHTFAATIMRVTYGYTVQDTNDPYVTTTEAAIEGFNEAAHPGAFLVDLIPALKYVPAWFPGAGFKRKAARWRKINQEISVKPFEMVKEQIKNGTVFPSIAATMIEKLPSENDPLRVDEELVAINTASVTYIGGADTTVSAVKSFFLAMALYPDVMRKAQAELDAVVGGHRLPDFSDRPALPYITAMVKETMRWHLVGNLGTKVLHTLGHMATEDDEYNGYFIPKETVVLGNGWSILHDPEVYKEPHEYIPDRFLKDGQLDPSVRDPSVAAFGYGRRICPGRHFSDNGLFMIIASTLAAFDILPPLDSSGQAVKPRVEYAPGLLSYVGFGHFMSKLSLTLFYFTAIRCPLSVASYQDRQRLEPSFKMPLGMRSVDTLLPIKLNLMVVSLLTDHPYHTLAGAFLFCAVLQSVASRRRRNPRGLPLPPGPKGWPIIGNILDMPTERSWLTYHEWAKEHGDMVYFEVLGQPFLVLDTLEKVVDLLEKRSANYSDRMRLPMLVELSGLDIDMALLPYNQWWRRHRRAFHEHFNSNVVAKYQLEPVQLRGARKFLQQLLETPDDFLHHIRHTFAATIMQVTYGYTIKDMDDPYVWNAEALLEGFAEAGAFLVDLIPVLKYVPAWIPGAGFQRKAARWRKISKDVSTKPFEMVREQMKNGTAVPSITSALIEKLPNENEPTHRDEEQIAMNTALVTYLGGADTTVAAVKTFFLAMTLYPQVMKKAQAELDAVVGSHRLPDFTDQAALPYISAMVKETMRWHLPANLGLPHMATEDDEYNGYFIPKGTVVMGNGWSILHDPEIYKDPHEYVPDRFLKDGQLDSSVRDPSVATFGYGRRICPGRHFSDNGLFIMIASTLAVFDILPPLDSTGQAVKPREEFAPGLLSRPEQPMVRELMGWDFNFAFRPYGPAWRKDRRIFHEHFHQGAIEGYQPMQLKEAHAFLNLLLTEPDGFLHHVRHAFSATIIRIAYGISVKPHVNSVYVTAAEAAVATLSEAAIPGTFLVDIIPALKYVPQWFPGASFKRKVAQWKKELNEFINLPFNHVKDLVKTGKAVPSLATMLLDALPDENDPLRTEEEDRAKCLTAAIYAAGADTMVSTVQTFFLAMAMHPEVVRKAQAELDAVVGPGRLPEFFDRPMLPYIAAVAKECLRWKLVANLGIAHALSEDDEYRGYFIPKGTIVIGNAWAILHDPDAFENPEEFIPERYLKDGQLDPSVRDPIVAAFGFGRSRICPGHHYAEQNLFILVASTLMAFDIRPPNDETGKPIQLQPNYNEGALSYPAPFKCQITPRNSNISKLIQDNILTLD